MADKKNILVGVTGSIACYKSCELITSLKKKGHDVKVAMSQDASHFITPLTLQALSQNKVASDIFSLSGQWDVEHVSLARWADVIAVFPATADMIAKIANGRADCILSAAVMAAGDKKVIVAPAMNEHMYASRIVQGNISKLRKEGFLLVGPERGRLACGADGTGHIADTEEVVGMIEKIT